MPHLITLCSRDEISSRQSIWKDMAFFFQQNTVIVKY